ncbi:electron transport complex subunit RnfC [Clostridium acetireducens DSM 10703]|jgi:electron transport complex protein RnfC|uniref:Ion-translocating oxidoreductase complex subunit C n=1 Tax=Clostridium acetireducens DSM 10703 TaxID=1121290 RepID=A0A1E8EY10_9CLOT|nr:electron transport complex subunit RsxC [Clostridium acetireducens]OFI05831.1 electron transport complex subunit RnfC [Clostridium acetireducens DSM 10703]
MNALTFKRGIHPPYGKELSNSKAIEELLPKGELVYPMSQHIGAPCEPIVKKGDKVLVGQKIGEPKGFVSAAIFSSVSGTVKDIKPMPHSNGTKVLSIIIENDGQYEEVEMTKREDYKNLSKDEILKIIQEAGVVGMGGATFPTHVKLAPPPDKNIDSIIINGAECEPYLTCDHRTLLENGDKVVEGLKIILHMFPEAKGYIAIENNKPDAIKAIKKAAEGISNIKVCEMATKYPQGAEKQLIYAITGREVPSGKLPADVGCIVQNVQTAYAIQNAVLNGSPLISRVVTVTGGAIKEPKNFRVRLGMSFRELVEACGGFKEDPIKVIAGGPMMGMAMSSIDVPVIKGSSSILCLTKAEGEIPEETNCIRCGKCVEVCPMGLQPSIMNMFAVRGELEEYEKVSGLDCIECGCCSFACPAKRHLVQSFRTTKRTILANRKKK